MMLSAPAILARIEKGDIVISPFVMEQLNPNSYNLRLGDKLLFYDRGGGALDMKRRTATRKLVIPPGGLVLEPGKIYLGETMEHTETRNLVPQLQGRSSTGRLGLNIHCTAGFGDNGFRGKWTLELTVVEPLRVYAGEKIAQISYHELSVPKGETAWEYSGKYQDAQEAQAYIQDAK